jgi:hypothetical protein
MPTSTVIRDLPKGNTQTPMGAQPMPTSTVIRDHPSEDTQTPPGAQPMQTSSIIKEVCCARALASLLFPNFY